MFKAIPGLLVLTSTAFAAYAETPPLFTPATNTQAANQSSASKVSEAAITKYTCPMHPQVISDKPGKCPICGMDLVPLEGGGYGHDHGLQDGSPVISITAENVQKMGVRTAKASVGAFGKEIRATGIVAENERTRHDISSQIEGRVEDLHYSAEGDRVHKGDPFYTLVSPEFVTQQQDYISALRSFNSTDAKNARRRMKAIGIEDKVLDEIQQTRKPVDSISISVPASGVLTKLAIRNGHYLKVGDEVGQIQDLSIVWVEADLTERDAALIRTGQTAEVVLTDGTIRRKARVDYIYPTVNVDTRTNKIRLVVSNEDGRLKPGAYVAAAFVTAPLKRLTVPSESVLRSAEGAHVIVAMGEGKFQSRKVETGITSDEKTEIISGLKEGDEVVASGQFLIDSESNLRESFHKLSGGKQ